MNDKTPIIIPDQIIKFYEYQGIIFKYSDGTPFSVSKELATVELWNGKIYKTTNHTDIKFNITIEHK